MGRTGKSCDRALIQGRKARTCDQTEESETCKNISVVGGAHCVGGNGLRTNRLEQLEHLDVLPSPQELAHVPKLRQFRVRLALLGYPLPQEAGTRAAVTACAESAAGRHSCPGRRGGDARIVDGVVRHELGTIELRRRLPRGRQL